MTDTVVVSLFALIGTLAGTFGGILTSTKLTNFRLEQLEKKVEKHNSVAERTFVLEKDSEIFEEKIKEIEKKITGLEKVRLKKDDTQQIIYN